jgi:V8-like Glu-specific endopeptidase
MHHLCLCSCSSVHRLLATALLLLISVITGAPAAMAADRMGIFGADTREHFSHSDFAQGDLANVGYLKVSYTLRGQRVESTCSAFLVTPRLVLTAAHCVWNPDIRRQPDAISFWLRYNGQPLPSQQIFTGEQPLIPEAWKRSFDLNHDYAAIPLTRKSYEDGLAVASVNRTDIASALNDEATLRIVGYPGSKRGQLYFDVSGDYTRQGNFLVHHADIEQGQSGGPVLLGSTVIGVHSFMTQDFNASVLWDDNAMATITDWMQRYGG